MKRFLVLFAVLLLALPAVSFAGSATSRWDVTIGGFVKADFGYSSQGVSADNFIANRKSNTKENVYDEYGNYFSAAGETRLNFLIKGPDTWGAKSSAFIEGDFRGAWGSPNTTYGAYQLRHAFLKFDWPDSSLVIGQAWQPWGLLPCFCVLNVNELGPFGKGVRQPQITYTKSFIKELSLAVSLFSPVSTLNNTAGESVVNSYSRYPQFASEVLYKSDFLGKIGPWMAQVGLGGFIGKQKNIWDIATGTVDAGTTTQGLGGNVGVGTHFEDKEAWVWTLSLKGFIPIIPEKKPGATAGSLGLAWAAFAGQGWSAYNPGFIVPPTIVRGPNNDRTFANPSFTAGWGQLFYYLTNTVSVNAQYGQIHYNVSNNVRNDAATFGNFPLDIRHYILNLIYDPNPAVRLGVQVSRVYTKYMGIPASAAGLDDYGNFNQIRFAAYYFF